MKSFGTRLMNGYLKVHKGSLSELFLSVGSLLQQELKDKNTGKLYLVEK